MQMILECACVKRTKLHNLRKEQISAGFLNFLHAYSPAFCFINQISFLCHFRPPGKKVFDSANNGNVCSTRATLILMNKITYVVCHVKHFFSYMKQRHYGANQSA
jgi:hypothetical protein